MVRQLLPYSGYYFGLARWENRCGYVASQGIGAEFRECEFPLEELEALRNRKTAINCPRKR